MKKIISALEKIGRKDLARKVKAKIRLFHTPLEQIPLLVQQLKDAGIPMSDETLKIMVTDLVTMKTPSYNAVVKVVVDKYNLSYPTAELVVNIVNRAMELTEPLR